MTRKTKAATAPAPAAPIDRPLTAAERIAAFSTATSSFRKHFAEQIAAGMSDSALADALQQSLGIWGGSSGPGQLHVSFQGAGLRVWASTVIKSPGKVQPLFSGPATVAMAREVYGIGNPQDRQLRLL